MSTGYLFAARQSIKYVSWKNKRSITMVEIINTLHSWLPFSSYQSDLKKLTDNALYNFQAKYNSHQQNISKQTLQEISSVIKIIQYFCNQKLTTVRAEKATQTPPSVATKLCKSSCSSSVKIGLAHWTPQPFTPSYHDDSSSVATRGGVHCPVVLNFNSLTVFCK